MIGHETLVGRLMGWGLVAYLAFAVLDILGFVFPPHRVHFGLREVCIIACGLWLMDGVVKGEKIHSREQSDPENALSQSDKKM